MRGELGDDAAIGGKQHTPVAVAGAHTFAALALGEFYSCGLDGIGQAYCWGSDDAGQLGEGVSAVNQQALPVAVSGGHTFAAITASSHTTCALTVAGQAYCWGSDFTGQVGNGPPIAVAIHDPVAVSGSHTFTKISTGGEGSGSHTCALDPTGNAYCWGANVSGQLGDGFPNQFQLSPVAVAGNHIFSDIAVGGSHTCALDPAGMAYCWGQDDPAFEQLGNGTDGLSQPVPVPISGVHTFTSLVAGGWHTCGLTATNDGYCWGSDSNGQLGEDGVVGNHRSTPVRVTGGHKFQSLAASFFHTCGVIVTGDAYCWGNYLGCRMYESDPALIRVTTLERDVSPYTTDSCGMRLDTYNDEENSLVFITTPASVRTDWTFANDANGPPNQEWDTFWDAQGAFTDFGWSAEVRVPFSSVGFQVIDGQVVMGFSVTRTIVRNAESIVHPAIPPNWGPASVAKPTQLRKMILTGLEPQKPVYLTPYGLGGGGHTHSLDEPNSRHIRTSEEVMEFGGDLRYGITRNLNLDLTANTDFAQVEADDQQVNLTRFSLFFPEQRRFFQERSQIFEVPLGSNERLFHSRRIGLVDGRQIPIYGGGRIVGRVGDWDVGFLDMQTENHGAVPSENLGVARLRRRFLNDASYLGGIATSRIGEDGSYNVLYGSDASIRLFGQDYLTLNWAQTFDDHDDERDAVGGLDRSLLRLDWQRRGNDGVTYSANLIRAGEIFEPGMGFLRRRDYISGGGSAGYGWRPGAGSALNRYAFWTEGNFFRRNVDRSIESSRVALNGIVETRGMHRFIMHAFRRYEDLNETFRLSEDATVPVGSYRFFEGVLVYSAPSGDWFRPNASMSGGQFYDGTRFSVSFSPTWSVSRHLRLGGTYELNRIELDNRSEGFTSHLARLRTELTFTTRTSASTFVQYNSTGDLVALNFRFRYNPREGNDLYIVWNETFNSDRFSLTPIGPLSQERTLLIKYSHTFTLGL